jgi:WD40 repeat protein
MTGAPQAMRYVDVLVRVVAGVLLIPLALLLFFVAIGAADYPNAPLVPFLILAIGWSVIVVIAFSCLDPAWLAAKLPSYVPFPPAAARAPAYLYVLLLALLFAIRAGVFELSGNDEVATEIAVLHETTLPGPIAFSPNGKYLAVDSWGNAGTNIWDFAQQRIARHLPSSGALIWYDDLIAYSPNGTQFAICSNGKFDVYDTSTWRTIYSLGNTEHRVDENSGCGAISYTPDGKWLIRLARPDIRSPGNNVVVYDTSSWQVIGGFRTIPLIDAKNSIRNPKNWSVLDTPNMILIDPTNKKTSFNPDTLSVSKDGKYLALSGSSIAFGNRRPFSRSEVVIVNITERVLIHIIHGQAESPERQLPTTINSLDWNPDNAHIAFGPVNNIVAISIFDTISNKTVVSEDAAGSYSLVRYTPNGKYLIEKIGKKVEIWDSQHHNLLQTIKADPTYLAVSPDGLHFAMGGGEPSILDATPMLSLFTHPNGPKGKVLVYRLK